MTVLLTFLARSWPFLACLGVGLGTGGYLVHLHGEARYEHLQADFNQYRTQVATDRANAEQTARKTLQKHIQARLDAETRNGQITQQLHDATAQRDNAARDALFARRLLAAAQAEPVTTGRPMLAAGDQPGIADPPQPSGNRPVAELLTAAATEARGCFEQYRALLAELQPQLK